MKRVWGWLALAVGLGVFAWTVRGIDVAAVAGAVRRLGFWAPLLLVPYLIVYTVDTWAWRQAFSAGPAVGFWKLFRIRWCGESVNNVIPTGYVGGEAVKVLLLRREGVPGIDATAAALASKTAQTIGQVLFILAGAVACLWVWRGPGDGRVFWGLGVVVAGACALIGVLLWLQRRGIAGTLDRFMSRLGIRLRAWESRRSVFERMDAILARFYGDNRWRFALCTFGFLVGWMLDVVEVYVAGRMLGLPVTWPQALVMESFTSIVKVVGLWVPGALGVQESGIILLARWVGAPELFGPVYALLRRARELIYVAVGWALLSSSGIRTGRSS